MTLKTYHDEPIELCSETAHDVEDARNFPEIDDYTTHLLSNKTLTIRSRTKVQSILRQPFRRWYRHPRVIPSKRLKRSCSCVRRPLFQKFVLLSYSFLAAIVAITVVGFTFFPSYTQLPLHYAELQERAHASTNAGRGNPSNQKVFIAASVYDKDGNLAGGAWARNVLDLIDLLGPENTYLSIYENDGGPVGKQAMEKMRESVKCEHSLVFEEHLGLEDFPQVTVPDGSKRVKRIAYLAEVRNKALEPLDNSTVVYDKLLYLNDVIFNPVDALQLLFSTNQNEDGIAEYRAACAVDFINPFKFYDTFATRDLGGYSMGVPFFPWFAYGGDPRTLQDIIGGSDAVRVRSCWGGMVAFDARFFQRQPTMNLVPETEASVGPSNINAPYKFRVEKDLYWDASECCLIHADIQSLNPDDRGIYMNPFIRTAYTTRTHVWLWFTRRFEQLYTPIHFMIDILVSLPHYNPRRAEQPWERVEETVWVPNPYSSTNGSFQTVPRLASHSGFCGRRKLPVMRETWLPGEEYYDFVPIPPL